MRRRSAEARIHALIERGRMADAERLVRDELSRDIGNSNLFNLLSLVLFDQGKYRQAYRAAREAVALNPESAPARYRLAKSQLQRSERDLALESVGEAIRLNPTNAHYFSLKARALACGPTKEETEEALAAVTAGLAIDPNNLSCLYYRTAILGLLRRHQEADASSLSMLERAPDDGDAHEVRARLLFRRGDVRSAERHYVEALRLNPLDRVARGGFLCTRKMANPLFAWPYRMRDRIEEADCLSGPYILLMAIVLTKFATGSEQPAVAIAGEFIRVSLWVLLLAWGFLRSPLSNVVLLPSRRGRLLLSDDERKGIRWAMPPLFAAGVLLLSWIATGQRFFPLFVLVLFSLARLACEVFETDGLWARRCFAAMVWLAAAVVLVPAAARMWGTGWIDLLWRQDRFITAPGLGVIVGTWFAPKVRSLLERKLPEPAG